MRPGGAMPKLMKPMISLENIVIGQPTESHEDAIRRCGQILVDNGYASERYIEGMLRRDEQFTTSIGNHIAIPHGEMDYKKEINHTGLSVITYPDGIPWGDQVVHLVIGIAAQGDEHIDILENIVDQLETGDDVLALVAGGDKNAIYEMLNVD